MKEILVRVPEESLEEFYLYLSSKGLEPVDLEAEEFEGFEEAAARLKGYNREDFISWKQVREDIKEKYGI